MTETHVAGETMVIGGGSLAASAGLGSSRARAAAAVRRASWP